MALVNRKCICDLCSCGRHHCPHLPTKIYEKTEKPCFFSEYTEKYPTYHSYMPRESFKPKVEYHKVSIPMEGLSTTKRDFGAYNIVPVKHHLPEKVTPIQEEMDFLTTYNQHYNYCPSSRVNPIKPRDNRHQCNDKMEWVPTYKADYLPWNQQKRSLICPPQQSYRPASCRFDHRTTHQDDYPIKNPVDTVSYKPPPGPKLCNLPVESMTSYRTSYVAHPMEKRCVYEGEKYKPCEIPFDGLTTHKDSYKGLMGEPAKSWKPAPNHPGIGIPFSSNTEFREKFLAWPTPKIVQKEPIPYIPPEGKMDLLTTSQADYKSPNGAPAQSCRPAIHLKKSDRFEGSTTNREDYKHWANIRREPVKPAPQLKFPEEPMDYMTTNRAHFVPHVPVNTKTCKPTWSGPRVNIPLEGQTTYSTSFTPKEIQRCPASYSEPPGYIFEEVDSVGHRMYRPASQVASQESNHLGFGDS